MKLIDILLSILLNFAQEKGQVKDGQGMRGLGEVAGAHRGAAGAARAADRHVRHQLRVPRRAHAAQVSSFVRFFIVYTLNEYHFLSLQLFTKHSKING